MVDDGKDLHAWDLEPAQAVEVQLALRERLILAWDQREVHTVGGVDLHVLGNRARAAIVVLGFPDLNPRSMVTAELEIRFPYVPGLLAFREGPAILAAWEDLTIKPDLLLFDGQGIAHPRRFGIASHMGLWLGIPSIGVGKSRLYGIHEEPGPSRGSTTVLFDERDPSQAIGMVLRTREGSKPLYISPGHLTDIPNAVEFVLKCCKGHRLPEPTRWAHRVAGGEKFTGGSPFQGRLFM